MPEIGTELEIKIERFDNANGLLVLSRLGKAVANADWSSLAVGMVVEAKVTGVKASGLEVMVNSCRGWLPASQVDLNRTFDLSLFADQKLTCEVIEVDQHDHNLIVSRRVLLERQRAVEGEKLWGELAVDQIRKGIVRSIQSFGAFVDIGGADALLPISQISWKRITNIGDVLHPGQAVEVKILTIDLETKKKSRWASNSLLPAHGTLWPSAFVRGPLSPAKLLAPRSLALSLNSNPKSRVWFTSPNWPKEKFAAPAMR